MTDPQRPVALTFLDMSTDDGVALLTLNRPKFGNALNWPLLEQLRWAVGQALVDPDVRAIVIDGAGKTFVSGADVGFFSRCVKEGNLQRVVECIRASQEVFQTIADSPKPVVAKVHGAALGGGIELALACHRIIATPRASFCFPEVSLGIYPSSGGTYRLPRRLGPALAKWLISTCHVLSPARATAIGLVDQVVPPDQLDQAVLAATHQQAESPAPQLDKELSQLEALFTEKTFDRLFNTDMISLEGRLTRLACQTMRNQPRLPLQWIEKLIDESQRMDDAECARRALEGIPSVFSCPEIKVALAKVAQQQAGA